MKTFPIIGAALLLAACGANESADSSADDTTDAATNTTTADAGGMAADATAMSNVPTDSAGYVAMAGAGDMWEIESSQAFLAKSDNANLKKFAQNMQNIKLIKRPLSL